MWKELEVVVSVVSGGMQDYALGGRKRDEGRSTGTIIGNFSCTCALSESSG